MYRNIILMVVTLLLTSCGLIPNTYLAAPISGTVLDEKTKQPLEGVHVVVYWNLHKGSYGGRVKSDVLHVEETITDKNGKYAFKGWGPVNTMKGQLGYESPELIFFKPGYYYQRKGNYRTELHIGSRGASEIHVTISEKTSAGVLYHSLWDGVKIRLKEYDGDFNKIMRDFSNAGSDFHNIFWGKGCESIIIRNTFTAYSKTGKKLIAKYSNEKIKHSFYMIENSYDRGCGEVSKIYNGYAR